MCGITGVIGESGARLDAGLKLLSHRGPDALGTFSVGPGAIGQARLAIIDLDDGDPPLTDESGRIGSVLNGEIYNHHELRRERVADGHRFASRCDTEVIAHLAEDHEPIELARRLDGMFAFAVWDADRERLVLGRDRAGKKPLYYWCDGNRLIFGSEIKAVLAQPGVPERLAPGAVEAHLTFGYVPTPRTFYEGVVSLPPAHVLTFEPGSQPVLDCYWEPSLGPPPDDDRTFDDSVAQFRRLLDEAVARRLESDVPLGAFLSGGVDSSAVVALMARHLSEPVRTFTIGFEDDEYDERQWARMVARRYGCDHRERVVQPASSDLLDELLWHHDQPFGDSSALPTYLVSQLAGEEVRVVLSGDGGDELLAGYDRLIIAAHLSGLSRIPDPIFTAARLLTARLPARALGGRVGAAQRLLGPLGRPPHLVLLDWAAILREGPRGDLLGDGPNWSVADYADVWTRSEGAPLLNRLLDLTFRTYLPDDILVKVDRMAMAHALEVRSPFLDTEVVEFARRLPPAHILRGTRSKRVLRAAVADLLPEPILERPKQGFAVPLRRWFQTDLAGYLDGMLGAGARVREHVDGAALDRLLSDHRAGAGSHEGSFWGLLSLEVFLRRQGW